MNAPRTEAGRAMLADWGAQFLNGLDRHTITEAIRAIEAESRAAEGAAAPAYREALREAVRATVGPWFDEGYDNGRLNADVLANRILAAVDGATPAPPAVRKRHQFTLVHETGEGDLGRCSCGESGYDFAQGREWFAGHLAAVREPADPAGEKS